MMLNGSDTIPQPEVWRVLIFVVVLVAGCSSPGIIPESLQPQINPNLTFDQVLSSPESYRGQVLVVGGEVLKVKRIREGTQLELLQLPLDDDHRPVAQRTQSEGRLLAIDRQLTDPATLPDGTPVTLVGEVTGVTTDRMDEAEYRYPTLEIKHLHVWRDRPDPYVRRGGPFWGIFGGVGFGGGTRSGGGISIGTGF